MSIDRGMDKEDVVHIYSGILLSHRKERNWVICRDVMDLETVIQSEVSQKDKYHILTHICGIQKNGTDEPVCKAETDTDVENKHMDTKGGKRGGGWWWCDELGDWD